MAVLCGGSDASDTTSVLSALESLRCLSDDRLDSVDADEAAAYEAVLGHVSGMAKCAGDEVVSSWMALHTLGCRNGIALCGRVDVVELAGDAICKWLEYASSGGDDYAAGGAVGALQMLCMWEGGPKMPSESREPIEKAAQGAAKSMFGTAGNVFTEQGARKLYISSMNADVLRHEDISLACGWGCIEFYIGYVHPGALTTANESGAFSTALELLRRVEPSPLPDEWWLKTCDVVDVTSSQLACLWTLFGMVKRLPSAMQSSWWPELLDHAIRMCKLNASAGLSERDTMCFLPFQHGFGTVELAAQDESQHEMLIASDVADALEYGILHDFTYAGNSTAAYPSGAAVALVGRNEGGKVLRREAVQAVLERLRQNFDHESFFFYTPPKSVMAHMARVTVMVISDANKKHMLQFEPLIDMLLECLIIDDDNHRKGQDGADMLQEASAGVLHELSLFGPGAAALRSHASAVSTLQKLCEVGTKVSKERGAAALFEVEDGSKRSKAAADSDDDGSGTGLSSGQQQKPPPHVMASYNWDHQEVILRVVTSLQDRGYLVWVDTEQMKGATVDTMALAVEGSEVVLIGVSRAYKESSNCRMEAQYALQKKKALVPLMMTEGYEADGWLGLLLGTSMWYGFYGETLSSVSVFESRMDALCREIGSRGRADAMVAHASSPSAAGVHATSEAWVDDAMSDLEMELQGLKLMALQKRALSVGASEESVEDAMEYADQKASLIGLIVDAESRRGPADRIRSCLEGGGEACAEMISDVLEHAMEVLEGLSVSSPRKSRKGLLEMMEHVESRLETVVDAGWYDGVCRCGEEEIGRLSSLLVSVRGLSSSSSGVSEMSDAVTALLECLDRCGSVVVQSMAVLSGRSDASDPSSSSVLSALESLRCLSEERLDGVDADEAAAYEAVLGHVSGLDACAGDEVVSSWMALHTLGCRNGLVLCGRVDVMEIACAMECRWLEYASSGGDDYEAGAAVGALQFLGIWECGPKMPSESREPIEKACMTAIKSGCATASKVFTEQGARKVFANSMKAGMLSYEDISLASGWGYLSWTIGYVYPGALSTANESGVLSTALELYRRVEPSPLPGEWWLTTCDVVDVTSSQLACLWGFFSLVKRLPSAMQSSWWPELLDHAIRLCKLNASAGLSGRGTFSFIPFLHAGGIVEFAAQDEAQHEMLAASDVADALEYAILHDFT
eukprot:COSAG06_NODE_4376_length_4316_cov_699.869101_1_plen_1195_part_10